MSYNLVNPTTGALTRVSGNITSNIIPANASANNKLATEGYVNSVCKNIQNIYNGATYATDIALITKITEDITALAESGKNVGGNISAVWTGFSLITGSYSLYDGYGLIDLDFENARPDGTHCQIRTHEGSAAIVIWSTPVTISVPQNGLITITSVLGANADATTTYTNVGVGDLVSVVIDSGVLFTSEWWGTVSGLSSLGITHIQNVQGISGGCRILARVCKTNGSMYLDLLRDSGVATKSDISFAYATKVASKQYAFNFNNPGISILEIIATGYSDVRVAGHWIVNCVGTFGPSCQVISDNSSSSLESCTFSVSDTVLTMSFAEEPYSVLVKELGRA